VTSGAQAAKTLQVLDRLERLERGPRATLGGSARFWDAWSWLSALLVRARHAPIWRLSLARSRHDAVVEAELSLLTSWPDCPIIPPARSPTCFRGTGEQTKSRAASLPERPSAENPVYQGSWTERTIVTRIRVEIAESGREAVAAVFGRRHAERKRLADPLLSKPC
jgi:hypothetical protein